jgi:hypothetical protein
MQSYIPILISLTALVVSAFALGWNIYRDVILKPRVRVQFGIRKVVADGKLSDRMIYVSGVNYGPGPCTCVEVVAEKKSLNRRFKNKWKTGFAVPDFDNPLCTKLPHRLNVAEEVHLFFPMQKDCILAYRPTRIGITDSFGRIHWASRKETKAAVGSFLKEFPQEEQEELVKLD